MTKTKAAVGVVAVVLALGAIGSMTGSPDGSTEPSATPGSTPVATSSPTASSTATPEPTATPTPAPTLNGDAIVEEVEAIGLDGNQLWPIVAASFSPDFGGVLHVVVTNTTMKAGAKLIACEGVKPIADKYGIGFYLTYPNGKSAATGIGC